MSRVEIAVLDDYQHVAEVYGNWKKLPEHCVLSVFDEPMGNEDQVAETLQPFEIICAMRERTLFPRTLLERLPNLKLLVTTGARNAAIDVNAAKELGITVSGTAGESHGTPELTWALILGASRKLESEVRNMREGRWQSTIGDDLKGKTIGILGLGRIGAQVARVARAFDMEVIAWSQNLTEECASAEGARLVGKNELFKASDIITIHMVLSDRSRGMVGAEELALMKSSALLVNTSRGPLVDEAELIAALHEGQIGGAAIDVYDQEPLPFDHPLRSAPGTFLTPHIGYVTDSTYKTFYRDMVENIQAYLVGNPLRILE